MMKAMIAAAAALTISQAAHADVRYEDLSNIRVDPTAIQARTHAENETPEQTAARDLLVKKALFADRARLHYMLEANKDPANRAHHCDQMMSYIEGGFTHIEGINDAPLRTAEGLWKTCMNQGEWQITDWHMTCIQPSLLADNVVHLVVRYDQNQANYTPKGGQAGYIPRIAVRDLGLDPKTGQMLLLDHGAFDVAPEAVSANCVPVPAHSFTPADGE